MNKIMAQNIQKDLAEAKSVRQSLDAMGRAISVTVGCQLTTGKRQKRMEILQWITFIIIAFMCFFMISSATDSSPIELAANWIEMLAGRVS